ncbi:MAG: hypothetical protein ABH879_05080 [archaeon]
MLLTISSVSALDLIEDPVSCENTKWYNPSTWFPCFSDKAIQYNLVKLHGPAFMFETMLTDLSMISFEPSVIAPYWAKMNYLAGVLFIIIVAYAGYLYLFSAFDLRNRIKAKTQVWNIFLIILFTNISLGLAFLVLEISNVFTRYVWTTMLHEKLSEHSIMETVYGAQPMLSLFYLLIFLIFGIPFVIRIFSRIMLLIGFMAALPLIITFNFFLPTKDFGRRFVRLFFINAFFPIIWILVFMFGKVIVGIISSGSMLVEELAELLVFSGCLYLNSYLYKTLGFNFSIRNAVSGAVEIGVTVWKTAKTVAVVA